MKKAKVLCTKPNISLHQVKAKYSTDEACKAYLKALRWPNGVHCPRCNKAEKIYELKARPFHWICKNADCGGKNGYRFSVITHTVFENTNYPLKTWFEVIYLMTQSKKGISALQIHRQIGSGDYRTAWYMCHRIRAAMQGDVINMLGGNGGEVEVDETFMGGKEGNKHVSKRGKGRGTKGKIPVIGAIARKGNVVCEMIENTDTETLDSFVRKTVDSKVSLVATDEHFGYRLLDKDYKHESVKHGQGEYVRGIVHTANIDNFWSLLKRGVMGTYHHMSKKYLPLSEFSFRHNNRQNPAIFRDVIAGC